MSCHYPSCVNILFPFFERQNGHYCNIYIEIYSNFVHHYGWQESQAFRMRLWAKLYPQSSLAEFVWVYRGI